MAFGGHSRGSIGTFDVANDPRLATTIHVAGGSFDGNGPSGLRKPALYIGGDGDFATSNVRRDYTNIRVPVWFNVLNNTDHILATRNGQHNFLRSNCTFCNLGVVQYKNWRHPRRMAAGAAPMCLLSGGYPLAHTVVFSENLVGGEFGAASLRVALKPKVRLAPGAMTAL
jgi:hypothetical protein